MLGMGQDFACIAGEAAITGVSRDKMTSQRIAKQQPKRRRYS